MNFRRFQMFTYTFLLISFVYAGCDPVAKRGINKRDRSGWTRLNHAISDDNIEEVSLLLDSGADVDATNRSGYSPLMVSIISGNYKIFLKLLKAGADSSIVGRAGADAMSLAVRYKNSRFIKSLEFFDNPNKVDNEGWPSIVNEAANGELSYVKVLLYGGADIDSTNSAGWSSLMVAISRGHTEIAKYLMDEDADINIKAKRGGFTALSIAKRIGNNEIIDEIIFLLEFHKPHLSERR